MSPAKTTDRTRHAVGPTVWSRAAAQFVVRAVHSGIDRVRLLAHAELRDGDLDDPDARIPLANLYALLEGMERLSGDPFVHLRVTRAIEFAALDALAFVVMTSPTFGAGIRAMLRYQRLWSDGEYYELEPRGEWAVIVYHPWGPPRRAHALMAEMFAVDVVVNAAAMTGAPFDGPRVLLACPPPADRAEHRALLDGVVAEFDRPRSEVWFRAGDLERPMAPAGQQAVCAFFERHLEERVRSLPSASVAGRARDVLMRGAEPELSVASLARRLRMSPRTLQRRLAEERTSVRELNDEARRARAIPLIEGGHAIAEVAQLLGFTEASAFHRAFRRWTGRTPESFRRSMKTRAS
jgi:AraC-like DNA-binding protein